jgi:hypothetical protein
MWPADFAKTYTDFSYRITVEEAPADPGADPGADPDANSSSAGRVRTAEFALEASHLNALDAGCLHCRYEEQLAGCRRAIDGLSRAIEELPPFGEGGVVRIDCSSAGLQYFNALPPLGIGSARYVATVQESVATESHRRKAQEIVANVEKLQKDEKAAWDIFYEARNALGLMDLAKIAALFRVNIPGREEAQAELATANAAAKTARAKVQAARDDLGRHMQTHPGEYGVEDEREKAALWFDPDWVRTALYRLLGFSAPDGAARQEPYGIGGLPGFVPARRRMPLRSL